jgi:hypothetical protein
MREAEIIELVEESEWIIPIVVQDQKKRRNKDMRRLEEVERHMPT